MTGKASTRAVGTEASGRSEPKSPTPMGGASVSEVLAQWLCEDANLAKRALSDEQFIALCADVMAWIGQRIAAVDAIPLKQRAAA